MRLETKTSKSFSSAYIKPMLHLLKLYVLYSCAEAVIGSVTCTRSLVVFGKLDGRMTSAPMAHLARDQINMGLERAAKHAVLVHVERRWHGALLTVGSP